MSILFSIIPINSYFPLYCSRVYISPSTGSTLAKAGTHGVVELQAGGFNVWVQGLGACGLGLRGF